MVAVLDGRGGPHILSWMMADCIEWQQRVLADAPAVIREGSATDLTIRAALDCLHQKARIVGCFSAGNQAYVAAKTGLPRILSPTIGCDANELRLAHGIQASADLIKKMLSHG
jgi:hypothetical protein